MRSILDNSKRREDKQTLLYNLFGSGILFYKYYGIVENGSSNGFIFNIDDINRPLKENGFGIEGFTRPYLDELLYMIQNEDGLIKIEEGGDKLSLTQKGINRCLELAIQQ